MRYAMLITEETRPIITKLSGTPFLGSSGKSDYIVFVCETLETEDFRSLLMDKETFFRYYPQADPKALLQLV